ncbi:hypothetical protein [Mucilaginibacter sp.]
MLYLIWCLLNVGVFLYFVLICFEAIKIIRERIGVFAAVIFVLGLLSFTNQSNSDDEHMESKSSNVKTWRFLPQDSLATTQRYSVIVMYEKTFVSNYNLEIGYNLDEKTNAVIPIDACSYLTGIICGTVWKPTSIAVNKTPAGNKLTYVINGVVDWKLLGLTLDSQPKQYSGTTLILQTDH